ncbi:MAG: hypothetical protein IPJ03_00590 [Ignavibacteriales bacterium]|nr:hypothetical protein [Ignavibacteriales bacterium]
MIHFLRRKRKQLSDDNKVLKYLKYAFGEIILVVLGILIALQINNWNQRRLEHAIEQSYLIRLKNELTKDAAYLNYSFDQTEKEINKVTLGLQTAYEIENNKEDINKLLGLHSFYAEALTINKATYDDLVSTQNLNIIRNDSLRFLIVDYYRNAEQAARAIDHFNQLAWDMQIEYMSAIPVGKYYSWNIDMFADEKLNYKEDFSFINKPTSYEYKLMETFQILFLNKHGNLLHFYKDLKIQATEINDLINQELE